MFGLMRELFPICRSITGSGLRQSIAKLGDFDWTVPKKWKHPRRIYDTGRRVLDFQQTNLHVVNYSAPVLACPKRAQAASAFATGASRLDPLSNVLLRGRIETLAASGLLERMPQQRLRQPCRQVQPNR